MTEIALYGARNRQSELIERVHGGEVINITRRGKVVALLAMPTGRDSASAARDAVAGLLAALQGGSLGRLKARDLINEGRR